MSRALLLAVGVVVAACSPKPATSFTPQLEPVDGGAEAGCGCAAWGAPLAAGTLQEPALNELSGLAASRLHTSVLYAHNDSGDVARFFALSTSGGALGEFRLDGGAARDWEDLAVGPCPQGSCVYVADFGDNLRVRTDYALLRVPEPEVGVARPAGVVAVGFERFPFEYPAQEKHNAEALLVHPQTGRVYVVTKEPDGSPSFVYRFPEPLDATKVTTLEKVADLRLPGAADRPITGGDVSPCGTAVLLRMYNRLVELRLPAGVTSFESVFGVDAVAVPVADEPQGEAVAYSADGRGYFTASEKLTQAVPLNQVGCR